MSSREPDAPDETGFADFFAMSLDCLCVAGLDGYLKRVSPSWTTTLGWTAEELLSRPSVEFVHPDDREATLGGRARLSARTSMGPLVNRYLCRDGSFRWFEWRSIAHPERGLVYAAARDITDQKLAEERLREANEREAKLAQQLVFADRLASVGTLAAGVAHEINNPLASVTANIELLIDELEALGAGSTSARLAESRAMAIDVRTGAERIRKIVLSLKTFSRAEGERRVDLEVRPVLELAVDLAANEIRHRAQLVKDFGPTPLVRADEARLAQVFINLLVNAAQALPEGASDEHEIRIATSTDAAGRAVIEIRDSGPGIPASIIGRIFDPFFTTKAVGVGTGLGLSVCHNLVTEMGGEITVWSEPGRGATFQVILPAVVAAAAAVAGEVAPAAGSTLPKPKARASILVVDDDKAVGIALRRVLRDHDVSVVTEARSGLELLASGKRFDVILSDLMMPEMSGMEFYDELTRRFPAAADRVVFISGGTFTPSAKAFLDRVPNPRLEKPFDPRRLREIIELLVSR